MDRGCTAGRWRAGPPAALAPRVTRREGRSGPPAPLRKLLLRVSVCLDASGVLLGSDVAIVADFRHRLPPPPLLLDFSQILPSTSDTGPDRPLHGVTARSSGQATDFG